MSVYVTLILIFLSVLSVASIYKFSHPQAYVLCSFMVITLVSCRICVHFLLQCLTFRSRPPTLFLFCQRGVLRPGHPWLSLLLPYQTLQSLALHHSTSPYVPSCYGKEGGFFFFSPWTGLTNESASRQIGSDFLLRLPVLHFDPHGSVYRFSFTSPSSVFCQVMDLTGFWIFT